MSKQTVTNTWKDGLNRDLNPMITPNTVLTDNLNGTFITYNGNEFSLQNDMGNIFTTRLSNGFYPIGVTEYGGIVYIVSLNNTTFEIGSFPSLSPITVNSEDEVDFEYTYRPLYNLVRDGVLVPFSTTELTGYDLNHPVTIEVQPSYDGSVNLILNDNKNLPRLINSGFAVLENGKGKFVIRNNETNHYNEDIVDQSTRLINISTSFGVVGLENVTSGGQLKCGNYTFYFKYGDDDGNQTDIVAESGTVSIFKGTPNKPASISGGFYNERTDKLVNLKLNAIDESYTRIYVYYTREYCDNNGFRLTEAYALSDYFKITGEEQIVTITGFETVESISIEDLNIRYFNINSAKTTAQQQNMLFLGNVEFSERDSNKLQDYSYEIVVGLKEETEIGSIDPFNYTGSDGAEYYNPLNIYYNVGYWPDEIYRFGIVYVRSDGTKTQAYNLKGCKLNSITDTNYTPNHINNLLSDDNIFLNGNNQDLDNIVGVFKTPYTTGAFLKSKPLAFSFTIPEETSTKLQDLGIIGYIIVRQKRIPITICQGFGVGINKDSYIPMLRIKHTEEESEYYAESFLSSTDLQSGTLVYNPVQIDQGAVKEYDLSEVVTYLHPRKEKWIKEWIWFIPVYVTSYYCDVIGKTDNSYDDVLYTGLGNSEQDAITKAEKWCTDMGIIHAGIKEVTNYNASVIKTKPVSQTEPTRDRFVKNIQNGSAGLISLDVCTNPTLQSILNGIEFDVVPRYDCSIARSSQMFTTNKFEISNTDKVTAKLVYLPENTALKYINSVGFSNKVGDGINVSEFGFIKKGINEKYNVNRGMFTPYIAVVDPTVREKDKTYPEVVHNIIGKICDIRIPHDETYKNDFIVRANDSSPFYAVTNITSLSMNVDVYRGDCFTNTVTMRMHRNFIDQTVPITDKIVKKDCWQEYYHGYEEVDDSSVSTEKTNWTEINLADLNTVSLGHWLTYRCISNSNLGLRSEDTTNVSEMALLGNSRSFYPLIGASTATGMKLPDSTLLNDGYNSTVSRKRYDLKQDTPYNKNEFSTRIVFSNISITDSFTNGYRIFQGLSYQDYTKQYGAIIKLLPYGNNLFCVFEHGLAIVPINEKALMQTTTEQTIHIYGHGVLPDQLSIISQDFGSIWADSIIRTPVGIYGVDTSSKKIWRFSDANGLETLSDMKLQRFLNDNINLGLTQQESLGITNVKTHFNNYKGDVMFTFYNNDGKTSKEWNLCYNERQGLWVTRYDWVPLFSANVDNTFYSIPLVNPNTEIDLSIWKHGRTGLDNRDFRPTLWYGTQHPFEFEFVVNEPAGLHKIFENLIITSNNVQPKEIDFQIIGDSYLFNRARIYHDAQNLYGHTGEDRPYRIDVNSFTKDDFNVSNFKPMFYNAEVEYDPVLDEYCLIIQQTCKNKDTYGIRLSNIQYKEDGWYTNIEPLRYNVKLNKQDVTDYNESDKFASAKIRDKWLKVRLKYVGDKLAVISGVTTVENISYS